MQPILYLFFFSFLFFTACKKDDLTLNENKDKELSVQINLTTTLNNKKLVLDSAYEFVDDYQLKVQNLKLYFSDISLVDSNGNDVSVRFKDYPENVFLYDLGKSEQMNFIVPQGNYIAMKFYLGLTPALNDINPNTFPANHPLSREQDTYWDMLKYRFLILEAATNYPNLGEFNHFMSYHLGGDEYLRSITIPIKSTDNQSVSQKDLQIRLEKVFEDIDFTTFFSFHSEGEFQKDEGIKMMNNLAHSIE
ncbi:MAG: hypothetical protein M9887_06060 [Chitinophagales bacterium]|nr:hypothetical protein [Chitinophagales bacterium]